MPAQKKIMDTELFTQEASKALQTATSKSILRFFGVLS